MCKLLRIDYTMTLPELCECNENAENMPNTASTTVPTSTTPPGLAVANKAASENHLNHLSHPQNIGEALKTLLQQASAQGRVTCSLAGCVELLGTCPDDVMLCVMPRLPPNHPEDPAATIQSTLIRAVCLEHNIRVLSVDCDIKLAKTVVLGNDSAPPASAEASGVKTRGLAMVMREEEDDYEEEEEEEEVDDNCNKVLKAKMSWAACSEEEPWFFTACDNLAPVMGFPCVLVRYPTDGASKEDELVAEFCKEQFFGFAQQEPYVELPD